MHHLKEAYIKYILTYFQEKKILPLVTAKIIFDDLRNFSLSGRGASEKPSVEQNNDYFLKWLGRGIVVQFVWAPRVHARTRWIFCSQKNGTGENIWIYRRAAATLRPLIRPIRCKFISLAYLYKTCQNVYPVEMNHIWII